MPDGVTRVVDVDLLALNVYLTGVDGVCAEDRARHFRAPRAHQAREANDFAALDLEVDVDQRPAPVEVAHLKYHVFAGVFRNLRRGLVNRAPDHHANDLVDGHLVDAHRVDVATVAHDRHTIRDARQLFEAVADVDDAHAVRAQLPDDAEQLVDLRFRQCRRRLVHDQHVGIERQRLGDFDHLLRGDSQVRHLGARVELEVQATQQLARLLVNLLFVKHKGQAQTRLAANEDVLGNGQVGHQVEFLMDHADAQVLGGPGVVDLDLFASDQDPARVLRVNAGEDLHQRRFSGAVLPDQRVHFAGRQLELTLRQRVHAREGLFDTFHNH